MKKYLKLTMVTILVATVLPLINTTTAHALAPFWKHTHWVTFTKNTHIVKMRNTMPMSSSYEVGSYTIKRGSHYKLDHWGVNYSWVLQSGKFNTNSKYTYVVDRNWNSSSWFKMGIHKISDYKSFHEYRVESRKSLYTYNTFYDAAAHSTLSDYRPTQKSKVIFEHGSHVYPKKHEWDWMHNDYLTEYRYKNGSWHKISTDYVDN